MPHIIVEYSEQLFKNDEVGSILQVIHNAIADSGLFDKSHIKTRAYPFREYTNAGGNDPYIHIQARIKSGRDDANKKRLGEAILAGLKAQNIQASVITAEIIDMDRDSYAKLVP